MEEEAPPMELVREKKLSEKDGLSCKKDLHSCGTKASDEEISDRLQENHDNTQPSDNHNYSVDQTQLPFLQALLRVQMKRRDFGWFYPQWHHVYSLQSSFLGQTASGSLASSHR
ncbi:hypothetical protein ZEAMMB73_Zm00001d013026 [Zea mays]|uniref:Uncharacterized protein n=1 Tax=Zea mays TaxID=4577 RepID=A0A1D6GF29_MAIZE|nr:hypothetical protein ZEAMMB73_Zm00001d013026 [Zea mays]|eukprot:XP_020393039.1 uncharacterized protein LOC100383644 isoform X4 [Zea mays]